MTQLPSFLMFIVLIALAIRRMTFIKISNEKTQEQITTVFNVRESEDGIVLLENKFLCTIILLPNITFKFST